MAQQGRVEQAKSDCRWTADQQHPASTIVLPAEWEHCSMRQDTKRMDTIDALVSDLVQYCSRNQVILLITN